ncbi:DUF4386 domain-containing protein [Geodermatophilus amargosae]|uniref:DUF4386 domain-containing protein n=1 Tax=Geodermatophilus amargosae TaxID=1296565 RepID=UPI0034DF773B
MTTTTSIRAVIRPPADPLRRTSLAAGILYLLTFVSVPTLALYQDARNDAGFVLGAGSGNGVLLAAGTEVVVAVTCIGTAVVFFPVLRRQSETAAIGFLASRVTEGALIIVGVVSVLTLFTLRTDVAGTADADPASLVTAGHALSATYDWTFLLSQSLMPVFNALFLGHALYRSGLVPRILPVIGLAGAPLLLASDVAIFFGVYDRAAPIALLAALPIAAWEFSLGVYLVVRGFRPSAVAALSPAQAVR